MSFNAPPLLQLLLCGLSLLYIGFYVHRFSVVWNSHINLQSAFYHKHEVDVFAVDDWDQVPLVFPPSSSSIATPLPLCSLRPPICSSISYSFVFYSFINHFPSTLPSINHHQLLRTMAALIMMLLGCLSLQLLQHHKQFCNFFTVVNRSCVDLLVLMVSNQLFNCSFIIILIIISIILLLFFIITVIIFII